MARAERGVSYLRTYAEQRCDLLAVGYCSKSPDDAYDFDNTARYEDAIVFQYTVAGEGRFFDVNTGHTTEMTPGKSFLVPIPSPTRYWVEDDVGWDFLYLYFTGDLAAYHVDRLVARHGFVYDVPASSPVVDRLIDIHGAVMRDPTPRESDVAAWLFGFLMELDALADDPAPHLPPEIQRACRHIDEHYDDVALDVERLAEAAGYSKYHFSRMFKEHVGASPHARLVQVRIRKALDMVASTDLPMKRVARLSGFRDYSYFCFAFKKHTGTTPGAARRNRQLR